MSLVRSRVNPAIAAGVTGIVATVVNQVGVRLSNEAHTALVEGLTSALEQGGSAFRRYIREWSTHFRQELGNEVNDIVQLTGSAISQARRQGGELYDALREYTMGSDVIMESEPSANGEGQHTRFIEPQDIGMGKSFLN